MQQIAPWRRKESTPNWFPKKTCTIKSTWPIQLCRGTYSYNTKVLTVISELGWSGKRSLARHPRSQRRSGPNRLQTHASPSHLLTQVSHYCPDLTKMKRMTGGQTRLNRKLEKPAGPKQAWLRTSRLPSFCQGWNSDSGICKVSTLATFLLSKFSSHQNSSTLWTLWTFQALLSLLRTNQGLISRWRGTCKHKVSMQPRQ